MRQRIQNLIYKIWMFIESILYGFIKGMFKLCRKDIPNNMVECFLQFIKFGIIGLSNTIISYLIYAGALLIFVNLNIIKEIDYLVAQVIAFILSVLWSFYWNNKFVFKSNDNENKSTMKILLKTYISYAFTGLVLNTLLSIYWVQIMGVSKMISPIINLLISVPLNFCINKYWAYR